MKYQTFSMKAVAIERDLPDSDVPCDSVGCTECCERLAPYLTPEEFTSGQYLYTFVKDGDPDKPLIAVPKTEHGCVYLDHNKKCTIYDRRPRACRQFDCRLNHHPKIINKFEKL
jgi:Fe-S-cluster containining protein